MSLDKAIEHRKEHRKQYRGSKTFDYSCRNHGDCDYCKGNRLHKRSNGQLSIGELEEEDDEYEQRKQFNRQ